jgi:predicted nucleic acid-binding protein
VIRYLLDTDVFSQLTNPSRHRNVATWLATVDDSELAISVLTVQERWKWIARAQKAGADADGELATGLQVVVDAFAGRIVPLEADAAKRWGLLLGQQEKHVNDKGNAMIAAANGLILVSRNVKDLIRLGVDILDPFKVPAKIHKAS